MSIYDAPNQEVVRPDGSAPWEEGSGGSEHPAPEPQALEEPTDLDELSKDELLELARERGIKPANAAMSKDELRQAVEAG